MASVLNQYSFVLLAAALALVSGLILLSHKPKWNDYVAFGVIVGGLTVGWIFLHPSQTPLMDNAKAVQSMIGAGKPVLLEFQSPY
jgi:hypothetical protein